MLYMACPFHSKSVQHQPSNELLRRGHWKKKGRRYLEMREISSNKVLNVRKFMGLRDLPKGGSKSLLVHGER